MDKKKNKSELENIIEDIIKVHYNPETGAVLGYYPNNIKYKSIPIPFIEIKASDQIINCMMCVINGIYQESKKSDEEILNKKKNILISERKLYIQSTDWYAMRLIKRNLAIPKEVIKKNILAANQIDEIIAAKNFKDLLKFSDQF